MFFLRTGSVLPARGTPNLSWRCGVGVSLAALAVVACVVLLQITKSGAVVFAILVVACSLAGRWFGGCAGCAASGVAVSVCEFLLSGQPPTSFAGTLADRVVIYVGIFAVALIASSDWSFLSKPTTPEAKRRCEMRGEQDVLLEATAGERMATKLLAQARPENRTYLVTARLGSMVRAAKWTSFEAGFVHGLAQAALAAPHNDTQDVESDTWIIAPDGHVLTAETIRNEQIGQYEDT